MKLFQWSCTSVFIAFCYCNNKWFLHVFISMMLLWFYYLLHAFDRSNVWFQIRLFIETFLCSIKVENFWILKLRVRHARYRISTPGTRCNRLKMLAYFNENATKFVLGKILIFKFRSQFCRTPIVGNTF